MAVPVRPLIETAGSPVTVAYPSLGLGPQSTRRTMVVVSAVVGFILRSCVSSKRRDFSRSNNHLILSGGFLLELKRLTPAVNVGFSC